MRIYRDSLYLGGRGEAGNNTTYNLREVRSDKDRVMVLRAYLAEVEQLVHKVQKAIGVVADCQQVTILRSRSEGLFDDFVQRKLYEAQRGAYSWVMLEKKPSFAS